MNLRRMIVVVFSAAIFIGCVCSTPCFAEEPQAETIPDRTTPDNLLLFYEVAHETKNLEMYEEALHESFRLYMDTATADRMGVNPEDAWIDKTRAVLSTHNMFEHILAVEINLVPTSEWKPYTGVEITPTGEPDTLSGMQILLDPEIHIHVSRETGEVKSYDYSESWFHVVVVPDPVTPGSWVILRILDEVDIPAAPDPVDAGGSE